MTDNLPTLEIKNWLARALEGRGGLTREEQVIVAREVLALRSQIGPHNKFCECDTCIPELAGVGRTFKEYAQKWRAQMAAAEKMAEALDELRPHIQDVDMEGETDYERAVLKVLAALAQWKEAANA